MLVGSQNSIFKYLYVKYLAALLYQTGCIEMYNMFKKHVARCARTSASLLKDALAHVGADILYSSFVYFGM